MSDQANGPVAPDRAQAREARANRPSAILIGGVEAHGPDEATVLGFLDTAFHQRKIDEAFVNFVGPYYRQHNPMVPDGIEG